MCNTIIFCFDFSQQKNQYRSPCYTRTTNIFTATDFQSENTACNKIIIKVRKMYGSTKSRHQRTDLKCQATSMLGSCNKKKRRAILLNREIFTNLFALFFSPLNIFHLQCNVHAMLIRRVKINISFSFAWLFHFSTVASAI